MRDVSLFLSLEHLEAFVGLLIGLISIFLCLGELGRPEERGRDRGTAGWWSSQNTHIYQVHHLIWAQIMAPQNNYHSNIKDHWSQIAITNIITMKSFKILQELTKMWHRDTKWANAVGRECLQTCPTHKRQTDCTNLQFVKNAISAKCNKEKHSKMRCACRIKNSCLYEHGEKCGRIHTKLLARRPLSWLKKKKKPTVSTK